MKIAEVAERTGMNITTIRYYEKTKLSPPIARGADGNRSFSATDLDWFCLLSSLRETGMPNSEMQKFAAFYAKGNKTIPDRKAMLLMHGQRLIDKQAELDRCAEILERKLAKYDESMGELS